MCIPGLHLSLGIYNRLYNLLENSCQEFDLQLAASSESDIGGGSYQRYSRALKRLTYLEEELQKLDEKAEMFAELMTHLMLTVEDYMENMVVQGVMENAQNVNDEADMIVSNIRSLQHLISVTIIITEIRNGRLGTAPCTNV